MATRFQLRDTAASEPMPNVKQAADAINRDVASTVATYANPADMLVTAGAAAQENSSTAAEPGATHYTHYGSWISPKLAAQTVQGTVTIALVMAEGSVSADTYPRVKIYKWLANDTFGSDLLALTTSGTETSAAFPASPITYFSAVAITSTGFALNDRIVIEIETYDNNTKTASYLHGIRFGGEDTGGYGGYVEFSADITWASLTYYQALAATAIGVGGLTKASTFYRSLPTTAVGVAVLTTAKMFSQTLTAVAQGVAVLTKIATYVQTLPATAVGVGVLTKASTFYRSLAATAVGVASISKGMYVTLAATAVSVAGLTTAKMFSQSLAALAQGVAVLTKIPTYVQSLPATAIGVAVLTKASTFCRTLAATAIGVAGMSKGMYKTLAATAVGVGALAKASTFYRSLAATAQGVATLTKIKIYTKTLAATAIGVATLIAQKISGGGDGGGMILTIQAAIRKLTTWIINQ